MFTVGLWFMIDVDLIKRLRQETGAGVMETKKAIEEADGDYESAKKTLVALGLEKAAKKTDREAKEGFVGFYVHATGKVAALVALSCETDFVARTPEFQILAKEIAMQAAAMKPQNIEELLEQDYVRDSSQKIKDLLIALTAKVGENIVIKDFKVLEV